MIYLDVSAAVHARAGLGRYSERLARAVIQYDTRHEYALFYNQGRDGQMPASLQGLPARHVRYGYKPWRMAVWLAHLGGIGFNRLVPEAQLYHSTEHLLMPLHDVPTVLTMHDLIFSLFPAYHKKLNYYYLNWAVPLFCRRASKIIAVSAATKQDLVAHYNLDPAKIAIVHEAAAENFQAPTAAQVAAVRQRYGLPDDFLIHLSTIEPRKNLSRLLDALQILRRDRPDLQLILAGAKGWLYDDFFARIEREGLGDVVHALGWVPDEDLPAVIRAASLAVQPSLYEGFGLPVLEHMASDQVVACSDRSSLPEIGGDAAAYFDPENVAEMAAVIGRLLGDEAERAERRRLGSLQAARFSWERAARETVAIYNEVLA